MSGFRLEVETHIITGAVSSIHNLIKCVQKARVEIEDLVLEPLASSEAVLEDGETDLGVALVDIGGGTTDIAIFADGAIWQTVVLPIGGNLITSDIAIGLRLPPAVAEELKVTYGHCDPSTIADDDMIELSQFMPDCDDLVPRKLLAEIIQARVEELFEMVHEEIKESGYDGCSRRVWYSPEAVRNCPAFSNSRDRRWICPHASVRRWGCMACGLDLASGICDGGGPVTVGFDPHLISD